MVDYAWAKDLNVISLGTLGPSLEDVFPELTGQQVGTVRHETQEKNPGAEA